MAKMSNAQLLRFSQNELNRSKQWRSDSGGYGYDESWRRYCDLYAGRHYDTASGTDRLVVNLIFATINVMAPAVGINNPRFVVNAIKPEASAKAIVTEEVLNYLWRKNDYQLDFRLAVLDWLITGNGWLKVGYKATKKPERKAVPDDSGSGPNADTGATSDGADEGIDDRKDVDGNVESELNMEDDSRPFVERISPFDVYVDPDARHPKEMRWIAQRTWRAVPDVQVDSRYSPTQRARVTGTHGSPWDTQYGDARGGEYNTDEPNSGSVAYAEIIEFYDLKRNTVGTFACDSNTGTGEDASGDAGWLIKPEEIPYATGHPFVMLRNYEVPDHFYTIGDVQQIESLQLELNETRTQMLNYRKKFRRAWTYKKDSFDRDGIRALESEEDNVMIPVLGDEDPSGVLAPVPAVITPPEFFDQSVMISNDLNEVSGVSDYARGNPQQVVKRTATEAAMIADSANARAQDRLMKIEKILAEAGKRVIQLMQQYMTGEQVARIVTLPVKGWINYDKEYIQGEFDYEVRGGSTEPQNETFRRQSALQLADVSAQFLDMGVADPVTLYMKLLRDGFGEQDPQRFINQPPPQEDAALPPEGAPPGAPMPPVEGGMPPGLAPSPGGMPMGPMEGPPPGMAAPGPGGLEMAPDMMDPSLGPPPMDLTPEMLAAMLAMERGQGGAPPPADMLSVPPPI
jgi:hypothetical protein